MIKQCSPADFLQIFSVINDGACAYEGEIPDDCYSNPYMSKNYLQSEIEAGVIFWGYYEEDKLIGVMGIQDVGDAHLIRHAYVHTTVRRRGVGHKLMEKLAQLVDKPILIGTWTRAWWAIDFYKKEGFTLIDGNEKDRLLRKYWSLSDRQIDSSIVMAEDKWFTSD